VLYASLLGPVIPDALGNILIAAVISTPAALAVASLMVPFRPDPAGAAQLMVDDPPVSSIPYLGGVSAVGAIVAVLVVIAPSGLGVREGAMYSLLIAVMSPAAALGTVVLNRLGITVVELVLLATLGTRRRVVLPPPEEGAEPAPDPSVA